MSTLINPFVFGAAGPIARTAPTFNTSAGRYQAAGNVTGSCASTVGGIVFAVVESNGVAPSSITSGWTAVPGTPVTEGVNGRSMYAYYKIATSTSESFTFNVVSDHAILYFASFNNVDGASPFEADVGDVAYFSGTTSNFPEIETVENNTLIINIVTWTLDGFNGALSAFTNASLTGVALRFNVGASLGNGGGFALGSGLKASPGLSGASQGTHGASTPGAVLTVGLKGAPA